MNFIPYKWWFQKNKDWNTIIFCFSVLALTSISGGSRKTRIETFSYNFSLAAINSISGGSRKTRIETFRRRPFVPEYEEV